MTSPVYLNQVGSQTGTVVVNLPTINDFSNIITKKIVYYHCYTNRKI